MNDKSFECKKLKATISPKQCLVNYIKAQVLAKYPGIGPQELRPCIGCGTGIKAKVYFD